MNSRRAFGIGQGTIGLILVAFPNATAARVAGNEPLPPSWLVRLLGLRLLGQGSWLTADPSDRVLCWGTIIDALHGSTMLAAVAASRSHRRSATVAAAVAAASVALSIVIRR
jgi:hypothetical protein